MKGSRHKSVLGISLGERSAALAEVALNGEQREVRRTATFAYPEGVGLDRAEDLGKALGAHLKQLQFSTRTTIVGISARRLVTKTKEVPPADTATLNDLLRLQAEGEFGSDLKDLVYDYESGGVGLVLLVATPRSDVEQAEKLCEGAGLNLVAVTPSSLALGARAGSTASGGESIVVAAGPSGVEVTQQRRDLTTGVRHLRTPEQDKGFAGSFRRTVLPIRGNASELIAWNLPEAAEIGAAMGMNVRAGDAARLGVSGTVDAFAAAAVAVAASGTEEGGPSVDFANSKLAPPKEQKVPRWVFSAAAAALILVGGGWYCYNDVQERQKTLDALQKQVADAEPIMKVKRAFNDKVSFAQAWHGGDPRYLGCLDEVTRVFPDDSGVYATTLLISEPPKPTAAAASPGGKKPAAQDMSRLVGKLVGKAASQQRVYSLLSNIKSSGAFSEVQLVNAAAPARSGEVSFTITFNYKTAARPTS